LPRSALGHAVRDDVKRAIKLAAAAQGRNAYELTEEALLEYLENHGLTKYLES
jgi:molecular chaperone GrpE (heat shock protein)